MMQILKCNERSKFYSKLNITESVCVKVNYTRLVVHFLQNCKGKYLIFSLFSKSYTILSKHC